MKVFIYAKSVKREDYKFVSILLDSLIKSNIEFIIYESLFKELQPDFNILDTISHRKCSSYLDLKEIQPDFVITLGGDGTILSVVTLIRDLAIPILGINLGRLGFLASIEKTSIVESIINLRKARFTIVSRSLLCVDSNIPLFGETRFGLNDFTLHKRDNSSMITIHTYINGSFLNSYWADGIIVSTPTGSTGYSLSCGGPIVFPNSGNFVITPVAPHNLTVRPIVISDNSEISFELEGRTENYLCTLDSRYETVTSDHHIAVRRNDFNISLVQMLNMSFLKTIHNKLNWGKDSRN